MSSVVVGLNSYASVADADAFLSTSLRAASLWAALPTATKEAALISFFNLLENQFWAGQKASLLALDRASVAKVAGGSAYVVGDVLTLAGGTVASDRKAKVRVLTVSSGAVVTFEVIDIGDYTALPASPASVTGGAGNGATFSFTSIPQPTQWPRSGVVDRYGASVDATTFPLGIVRGNIQGAFELSQDPSLETSRNQDSNIRSVHAGSIGVDFFAAQVAQGRFPFVVQELVGQYLSAPSDLAVGQASGFGGCSDFTPERYGLNEGLP